MVLTQPDKRLREVVRRLIAEDLYEEIGKLRNARELGQTAYLPSLAVNVARYGAYLIGLAHRHLYASGACVLEE